MGMLDALRRYLKDARESAPNISQDAIAELAGRDADGRPRLSGTAVGNFERGESTIPDKLPLILWSYCNGLRLDRTQALSIAEADITAWLIEPWKSGPTDALTGRGRR